MPLSSIKDYLLMHTRFVIRKIPPTPRLICVRAPTFCTLNDPRSKTDVVRHLAGSRVEPVLRSILYREVRRTALTRHRCFPTGRVESVNSFNVTIRRVQCGKSQPRNRTITDAILAFRRAGRCRRVLAANGRKLSDTEVLGCIVGFRVEG